MSAAWSLVFVVLAFWLGRGFYYKGVFGRFPVGRLRPEERERLHPHGTYGEGYRGGYEAGLAVGALAERERIVKLLKTDEARRISGCTGVHRVANKLAAGGWKTNDGETHAAGSQDR